MSFKSDKRSRIGRMRFRVQLRKQTDTPDGGFAIDTTYPITNAVWGDVEPLKGDKYFMVRNEEVAATQMITIRYCSETDTMGENDHLSTKGRLYQILSVKVIDSRNRFVQFECNELGDVTEFGL